MLLKTLPCALLLSVAACSAVQLDSNKVPETADFPQIHAEHPYNLSFIRHEGMQRLFGPMRLLCRR